jgi:hypothetical protein
MRTSFDISDDCAWVNYARCHDDIGWTFDDTLAANLGINGNDHRHFLNQFYTGRFEGTNWVYSTTMSIKMIPAKPITAGGYTD